MLKTRSVSTPLAHKKWKISITTEHRRPTEENRQKNVPLTLQQNLIKKEAKKTLKPKPLARINLPSRETRVFNFFIYVILSLTVSFFGSLKPIFQDNESIKIDD